MNTYSSVHEAADYILSVLKDFIGVNTLFIATNNGVDNTIIKAFNRNEQIVKEGGNMPLLKSYCSLVFDHHSPYVYIPNTSDHSAASNMEITNEIGSSSFFGVPIKTRTNEAYGTICAMDRKQINLTDKEVALLQTMASFISYAVELEQTAYLDGLTGLYNRNFLNTFPTDSPHLQEKTVFFFIDIDDFKSINDRFGHDVGDQVLIEFANRLKQQFQKTDFIIRMGGDEFLVMVNSIETDGEINRMANETMTLSTIPIKIDSTLIDLTISVGISRKKMSEDKSVKNLLETADKNMYDVKRNGKSAYKFI